MTRPATGRIKPYLAGTLLALSASAAPASGEHAGGHGDDDTGGQGHGHGPMEFGFGSPAPAAQADRTIEIVARDDMSFEPASVTIARDETVRFRVRNGGQLKHSFTLGDRGYHRRHDREMEQMPADEIAHHMADSPNGMVIGPGKTGTLTWRFERGGDIRFACHIPGHYPAGMWGEIETASDQLAARGGQSSEE